MPEFAHFHVRTARAGDFHHQRGAMPGETYVDHDQTRTYYRIPRGQRRGFAAWFAALQEGDYRSRGSYTRGYRLIEVRT